MSRRGGNAWRRQATVQTAELPQRNNSRRLGDGPDFPELGVRNPARNPGRALPGDRTRRPGRDLAGGPARDPARERGLDPDTEPSTRGRIVVLMLASVGGVLLLFLNPASQNRIEIVPPLPPSSSGKTQAEVTGDPVLTRWGTVQVQIVVRRGRIVKARGVRFPNRNRHGVALNIIAIPALDHEAVARQSAKLDTVSGVTITSQGYAGSLQSAIDRAHLRSGPVPN